MFTFVLLLLLVLVIDRVINIVSDFLSFFFPPIRLVMKKGSMYIMHMVWITQILFVDVIGCLTSM